MKKEVPDRGISTARLYISSVDGRRRMGMGELFLGGEWIGGWRAASAGWGWASLARVVCKVRCRAVVVLRYRGTESYCVKRGLRLPRLRPKAS